MLKLEALVNVGPNYKGPKVNLVALVKFGYMLESRFRRSISRKDSSVEENPQRLYAEIVIDDKI